MATENEHEELIQHLKFTPRTYRAEIWGWGGEIAMGKVDRKIYDYFQENDLEIDEYSHDWDYAEEHEIPEEMRPFECGNWYDCDDLCHESGATMDDCSYITVYDEKGDKVWESSLDPGTLEDHGIESEETDEVYINEQPAGTVVFVGTSSEKGLFGAYEINLTKPFDPKQLKFFYGDYEGWAIMGSFTYEGEDTEELGELSTDGKSADFEFHIAGGEEE
jgi:hypothetical protein